MANDDWYRNSNWDSDIEIGFRKKLNRARDKDQYLRIQASYLAESYPEVALGLLDEYFALDERFDWASGYVCRAEAFVALGKIDEAIASYEAALAREKEFTNLRTQANLFFPLLIVSQERNDLYGRAFEILDQIDDELIFPVDFFLWNSIKAITCKRLGRKHEARVFAETAVEASKKTESGFSYHQKVGLVGDKFPMLHEELIEILAL